MNRNTLIVASIFASCLAAPTYADLPPGAFANAIERYQTCVSGRIQEQRGNYELTVAKLAAQCSAERDAVAAASGKQKASVLAELDSQTTALLPVKNVTSVPLPTATSKPGKT